MPERTAARISHAKGIGKTKATGHGQPLVKYQDLAMVTMEVAQPTLQTQGVVEAQIYPALTQAFSLLFDKIV